MVHIIRMLTLLLPAALVWAAEKSDPLEALKEEMSSAACNHVVFLSLVESTVFGSTDTVQGEAWLGASDRYNVLLGADRYLATDSLLYSYSLENNQVTVEPFTNHDQRREQLSFLTRLDEFYTTTILTPGRRYRLKAVDTSDSDLPSPLLVKLTDSGQIGDLEYHDQNEDLNRIVFIKHEILDSCPEGVFEPDFPDSVEIIRF